MDSIALRKYAEERIIFMKFSFKEAEDVFAFDEALQKKFKENGFVSIYMALLLAGKAGKWAVDNCTYSTEEQKHFGWTSMEDRKFGVDMFPAYGQYKYVLEMPGSEPIHREIETGVKLDHDDLLDRIANLEDRVLDVEIAITKLEAKGSETKTEDVISSFFDLVGGKRNS